MISLFAPNTAALRTWADAQQGAPFTYAEVGATRAIGSDRVFVPPKGFVLDRRKVRLGAGEAIFAAARSALLAGRMFPHGWFRAAWPTSPIGEGDLAAVVARCGGIWWWNAARIVYVEDRMSSQTGEFRTAIAYGTLPAHVEMGEERFLVEQTNDGDVWYEVTAFSRPRHPLVRLAYPLARRMQHRFGKDSLAAMQKAVQEFAKQAEHSAPLVH